MWRIWVSYQILSNVLLLVKLHEEETLQELGYLNGDVLEPYKVSWCPYVNEMAVDWFSVVIWFGTLSSLSVRMQIRGLVHPLFVA